MTTTEDLFKRYNALPQGAIDALSDKDRDSLIDMGGRLDQYGSFLSDKAERFFSVLVRKAEKAVQDLPVAQRNLVTIPQLADRAGPEVAKVAAERNALAAEVVRLQGELAKIQERLAVSEDDRKEAEGRLESARAEIDAWRREHENMASAKSAALTEVARLKVAAPASVAKVSPLAIERAAKFGADQVEKALLIALRQQLAGEDAAKAEPKAPSNGAAPKVRVLDLEDGPRLPPSSVEAAKLVETAKKVALEIEARDAAPVTKTPEKAPQGPAKGPETTAPASRLSRCPKCKAFALGNHTCR